MKIIIGIVVGIFIGTILAFLFIFLNSNRTAYSLYRGSIVDRDQRIHIATFDAKESDSYNRDNCEIAKNLFMSQPNVEVRYWCDSK